MTYAYSINYHIFTLYTSLNQHEITTLFLYHLQVPNLFLHIKTSDYKINDLSRWIYGLNLFHVLSTVSVIGNDFLYCFFAVLLIYWNIYHLTNIVHICNILRLFTHWMHYLTYKTFLNRINNTSFKGSKNNI